jgi:hypothetical protein
MQFAAATVSRGRGPPTGRIVTRLYRQLEQADFCYWQSATWRDVCLLIAIDVCLLIAIEGEAERTSSGLCQMTEAEPEPRHRLLI